MKKQYKVGYTQGVYDMFHVGHLNLLNAAKAKCEKLIVGVNSDKLVKEYKGKIPIISEEDRAKIVQNIKAVDEVYIVNTLDKEVILENIPFEAIFIGSDWQNDKRWQDTAKKLSEKGVDTVFLPHTDGISSTIIRERMEND